MVDEEKNEEDNKTSFWEVYKYYILIGLLFLCLIISYYQGWTSTQLGTISLIGVVLFTVLLFFTAYKGPTLTLFNEEFAKDPKYYYMILKKYYDEPSAPRLNVDLTWSGKYLYYPLVQPQIVFLGLYDRNNQQPLVAIIRVMKGTEQVRGIIRSTWKDFIEHKIFRLKMTGSLQSDGGKITMVGKDGKPITMPGEYFQELSERGLI